MADGNPVKSVLSWTIGIASVAFILLLMAIIFGNLSGNTGIPDSSASLLVTNETNAWLNQSGYTLSGYNTSWSNIVFSAIWNTSASGNYNVTVLTPNASVSSGVVTNTSTLNYNNASLTYTYTYTYTSTAETNAENIISNYTSSAVNAAAQFPTVGTILGVSLLILVLLALLVYVILKMSKVRGGGPGSFG